LTWCPTPSISWGVVTPTERLAAADARPDHRPLYGEGVFAPLLEPDDGDWIAVTDQPLPAERARAWSARPECGAIVTFCGAVRDHSSGRPGVTGLEYEIYAEQAVPRLAQVTAAARRRWPAVVRLALLHRVGLLAVGDVSVVVVASTPHRAEAFDAARYCIDTLKSSVPIWKRETWAGGTDWSQCAHDIEDVG
jgi:molybdopterin synthase catalytic subunit